MSAISMALAAAVTALFALSGLVLILFLVLRRFFAGQTLHYPANALFQYIPYAMCQFFADAFFIFLAFIVLALIAFATQSLAYLFRSFFKSVTLHSTADHVRELF